MKPVQTIDVRTLHDWLEHDQALLIDVREPHEHARAHIPAAQLKPLSALSTTALPDAEGRKVVVCCASGARSLMAADRLLAGHYGEVYNLDGGLAAWRNAGYDLAADSHPPSGVLQGLSGLLRRAF